MEYKEYLQQLNQKETFEALNLSFNEFWELFTHNNWQYFKNWSTFLSQYHKELSLENYAFLEERLLDYPSIEEELVASLNLSSQGLFSINLDTLTLLDKPFKIKLNLTTIDSLKELQTPILTLSLKREVGTLTYKEPIQETTFLNSSCKKLVNFTLGLMLLGSFLDTSSLAQGPKNINSAPVSSSSNILNNVDLVVEELSKSKNPVIKQALEKIDAITFDDLKLATPGEEISHLSEDSQEEEEKVAKIIQSFYKKPISKNLDLIAKAVVEASDEKDLDYKLMLAIMKVESDFRQHVVSSTGDISVAQIRYETWSKDLWEVKKIKLDRNKLKKDPEYAIKMMSEVLDIIRDRHSNKDPHWYARYHSKTLKLKVPYMKKLHEQIKHIDQSEVNLTKEKVKEALTALYKVKSLAEEEDLDLENLSSLIKHLQRIEAKLNSPAPKKSNLVAFR